jgi:polyphosphate kinase
LVNIVGRYLEHSRILAFGNGGSPLYFISSADWMVRNIEHRIEATIPIYDTDIQRELQRTLDIQLSSGDSRQSKRTSGAGKDVQTMIHEFVQSITLQPNHKRKNL